jgi:putative endonuclease
LLSVHTQPCGSGPRSATVAGMTRVRQAIGAYGERLAARHLEAAGLVVVTRNWRCSDGEVDLILWDGDDLVFCEVKTRRGALFGSPAEAVSRAKVRRLRRLAARWLAESSARPREIRFDVVAVLPQRRGATVVEHTRAAF